MPNYFKLANSVFGAIHNIQSTDMTLRGTYRKISQPWNQHTKVSLVNRTKLKCFIQCNQDEQCIALGIKHIDQSTIICYFVSNEEPHTSLQYDHVGQKWQKR